MEVRYELQPADYRAFDAWNLTRAVCDPRSSTRVRVAIGGAVALVMLALLQPLLRPVAVPALLLVAACAFFAHLVLRTRYARLVREQGGRVTLQLTDRGIVWNNAGQSQVVPWSSVEAFASTSRHFLLKGPGRDGFVIPFRELRNHERASFAATVRGFLRTTEPAAK